MNISDTSSPSSSRVGLGAVVEPDHGYLNGRSVECPLAVRLGPEDRTGFSDPVQHLTVPASPYPLRREKTRPVCSSLGDLRPGLLEPVAAQVGLAWDTAVPYLEQGIHVSIGELPADKLASQEGRIADNRRLRRATGPRSSVPAPAASKSSRASASLMLSKRLQDRRLAGEIEGVAVLPLKVSDPDDRAGQLVSVLIGLDAEELSWMHPGEEVVP